MLKAGRYSDVVAAITAKAKLAGLWVERSERSTVKADPAKLTDEELAARIIAAEGKPN